MAKNDGSDKKATNAAEVEGIPDTEAAAAEGPEMYRFSVNLAADSAATLRRTAARRGITVTDAFRRAVAFMEGIDRELVAGRDIESVDPDNGNRTRIVFL